MNPQKRVFFHDYQPTVTNLITAAKDGNASDVRSYLNWGVDPNSYDNDHITALHYAAYYNYTNVVAILLSHPNINVNLKDYVGNTPVHVATLRNNIHVVIRLIDSGADVNIHNENGHYPLHSAVRFNHNHLVKIIVKSGAIVDVESVFGKTPLYITVIETLNVENMKVLVKNGANMELNNGKTMPILVEGALFCVNIGYLNVLVEFINMGCNLNIKAKQNGRTAMHMVALTGFLPLAKVLINAGALHDIRDVTKKTPLDIAIVHGNKSMANYLMNVENSQFESIYPDSSAVHFK